MRPFDSPEEFSPRNILLAEYDPRMKSLIRRLINFPNLCRGTALFLGCFVALNLLASFFESGFDANIWWIDLRWLPNPVRQISSLVFVVTALNYVLRFRWAKFEKRATAIVLSGVLLIAVANSIDFFVLLGRGHITSSWPVPVTLFVAIALVALMATLPDEQPRPTNFSGVVVVASLVAAAFTFLQMLAFGKTDYTRQSDIAVVLGARVYADGTLSHAAMDRVSTACDLYQKGMVRMLLFSGGPGDGQIHETEAMKRFAVQRGVPESAIILDYGGVNTRSTAQNTAKIFNAHGARRIIAVSHFYHLPRVKLAYQQEGWDVATVPARSDRILLKLPIFMARETVALFKYYFDPIVSLGRV
jgi:vancomycin permeability regulator SanA